MLMRAYSMFVSPETARRRKTHGGPSLSSQSPNNASAATIGCHATVASLSYIPARRFSSRHFSFPSNASAKNPSSARRSAPSDISGWYGASLGGYQNGSDDESFERYRTASRFAKRCVTTPPRFAAPSPISVAESIDARGFGCSAAACGGTAAKKRPLSPNTAPRVNMKWNTDSHVHRARGTFATRTSTLRHTLFATPPPTFFLFFPSSSSSSGPSGRSADFGTTLCHVPGGT
mmetsp:Transcript_6236/g.25262  ORF Transcript_6236/g.25262 Transcript_6236/m.25262 type:complete len:233 (-) Transcript_6236:785-1483(-)